ncbi:MAG: DUF2997 domain-containing protein [Cyanobacteriota bacterium]|jgi:hypothetical protein
MAQQTIRFRIRPDGRVEELVEGVVGEACLALSERIEAQLGSVQTRQATAAAYQSTPLIAQHPLTDHPAA